MKILVTGSKSGLGKYLKEELQAIGLDRDTTREEKKALFENGVDVIVHCAWNSKPDVSSKEAAQYVEDNLFLTKELTQIPHQKFIFISSVDVYSRGGQRHTEDEEVQVDEAKGIYAITKLFAEAIVKKYATDPVILRCAAFYGPYMRKNALKKIQEDERPVISLTSDSELNYVAYQDMVHIIKKAIKENIEGVYNIASTENMRVSEIAELYKKEVDFGEFNYQVGNINTEKVYALFPELQKTTKEVIQTI